MNRGVFFRLELNAQCYLPCPAPQLPWQSWVQLYPSYWKLFAAVCKALFSAVLYRSDLSSIRLYDDWGGINTEPVYFQYYTFIYTEHIYIEQKVKVHESLTPIFMQDIKSYFVRNCWVFRFRMKMNQQTNGRIANPNRGKYPLRKKAYK